MAKGDIFKVGDRVRTTDPQFARMKSLDGYYEGVVEKFTVPGVTDMFLVRLTKVPNPRNPFEDHALVWDRYVEKFDDGSPIEYFQAIPRSLFYDDDED